MTKNKKLIGLISVAVAIGLVLGGIYLYRYFSYQRGVEAIEFSGLDLSQVPNGSYEGSCDVDFIAAKVLVTVREQKITVITLVEHKNDRGGAANGIEGDIVAQQSLEVANRTGATNSSKVIKKAVQNALESAEKQAG